MNDMIAFVKDSILGGLEPTVRRSHKTDALLIDCTEEVSGDNCTWRFDTKEYLQSFEISACTLEDTVILSVDAVVSRNRALAGGFRSDKAISFRLGDLEPDAMVGSHRDNPWWMLPDFVSSYADLPATTQSLLIRSGDTHTHLLLLTGENFRAEIEGDALSLTSDCAGITHLEGAFLAVSRASDPFTAIRKNYETARACGALKVPLRSERTLPELFKGFGFCTWDCFYMDVTSAGIYEKLDEFRDKGIPVRWLIVDAGWMTVRDNMLSAFEVNDHFPEGLKAFVDKVKGEYGIEKVGVWHAVSGFWEGVDPESALYRKYKDCLMTTPAGFVVPSLDEDAAYRFWDGWHTYLEDCGVDFVKVDNQSSNSGMVEGAAPTASACRTAHNALERSVFKHFGGAMINCMGMDMENVLARPASAVSRNSDDFFPRRPRGFVKHLVQNAWNAMTHGQIYYCDFDMWWSDHESAFQNGVLRAIAGSPIYVSDQVGKSSAEKILASVEDDGTVMWMDSTAQPTLDIVYTDCVRDKRFLKVWNRSGEDFALAVYNVNEEELTEETALSDIPGISGQYVAYEYFSGITLLVTPESKLSVTLPGDGVCAWSLYAVEGEGTEAFVQMGSCDKFFPIASANKEKKLLSELGL